MINLGYTKFQGHSRCNMWENEDLFNSERDTLNIRSAQNQSAENTLAKTLVKGRKGVIIHAVLLNASRSLSNSG